jgi:Bacterial regulatory helix-turn-helix protein, lysR family
MNVSLPRLKIIEVAREHSFTRAAREFDLTQPAVSSLKRAVSRCVRELDGTVCHA